MIAMLILRIFMVMLRIDVPEDRLQALRSELNGNKHPLTPL